MLASTSTKEDTNLNNVKEINSFGITGVLKSSAIFGANGSGKTNIVEAMRVFRNIVVGSLESVSDKPIQRVVPFLLKENYYDKPSEFEITFLASGHLYRYGLSISEGIISEEWLYWTKTSRETLLFHRDHQTVDFNQRSFPEAKLFTVKEGNTWKLEKTRETVPFISVLSQFDGEKSKEVTNWFEKFNIISGLSDRSFKDFTVNLFETDILFKTWAVAILKSLQISDVQIVEEEKVFPIPESKVNIDGLNDALAKLKGYMEEHKIKEKRVEVVKVDANTGDKYSFPLSLESEGTRKLIYLLGPLYDVITNNEILVVDEFDNKFHSLLCRFIIDLYNKNNKGDSQLVITSHDTNLLTNELFRRDQIWFVEKNEMNESELYSLVEYKEYYTRKGGSYSKDYLSGKYGAIPLFGSAAELESVLHGER